MIDVQNANNEHQRIDELDRQKRSKSVDRTLSANRFVKGQIKYNKNNVPNLNLMNIDEYRMNKGAIQQLVKTHWI